MADSAQNRPAATVEEMKALAAALQPGETVRWTVRECPRPFRWSKLRLFGLGFGLVFLLAGAGIVWQNADFPSGGQGWAALQGVELFLTVLSLLFTLLPLLGCWAVGGFVLWLCFAPSRAGLRAFTERRLLVLEGKEKPEIHLLYPDMGYQLCTHEDGRSGCLILSTRGQMLTSPLSSFVDGLPDVREAESVLLSLTRAVLPPDVPHVPLSRFLADATRSEGEWVERVLCRGERLLHAERPVPACFPWGEGKRFVFFLMFVSFVLGLGSMALGAEDWEAGGMLLGGSITGFLLLAGLCGLLRPFLRRRAMARTLYLLTDRRALIIEPTLSRECAIFAYPLDRAPVKRCRLRADGSGDLVFASDADAQDIDRGQRGFLNLRDLDRTWEKLAVAVAAARGGNKPSPFNP